MMQRNMFLVEFISGWLIDAGRNHGRRVQRSASSFWSPTLRGGGQCWRMGGEGGWGGTGRGCLLRRTKRLQITAGISRLREVWPEAVTGIPSHILCNDARLVAFITVKRPTDIIRRFEVGFSRYSITPDPLEFWCLAVTMPWRAGV